MFFRGFFLFFLLIPFVVSASDIMDFSIEELSQIEVTSVSKKPQKLKQTPASVFVLSSQDIIRSGVTTIPDALRLVPGLQVAQIDGNKWAVTSRSSNGFSANKLLVLIDGRSIYTNLFSGVTWDVQDMILEDIDRIEVIKGPGASVWGVNAVNGVINIVTKSAAETKGTLVSLLAGNNEVATSVRQGVSLSENSDLRVYAKYRDRNEYNDYEVDAHDGMDSLRGGFRYDWKKLNQTVTFQGDIYKGESDSAYQDFSVAYPVYHTVNGGADVSGGNIFVKYNNNFSVTNTFSFQAYYDYTSREGLIFNDRRKVLDVEARDTFFIGRRNNISIGAGYRRTHGDMPDTSYVDFPDEITKENLYNIFAQDEIEIMENRLFLTLGVKFEYIEEYDWQTLPTARVLGMINDDNVLWVSYSKATRLPSEAEQAGVFKTRIQDIPLGGYTMPAVLNVVGDGRFDPEEVTAYEAGYRNTAFENTYLEASLFFHRFEGLRGGEFKIDPVELMTYHTLSVPITNGVDYDSYGFELQADYSPLNDLKFSTWYALSRYTVQSTSTSFNVSDYDSEHNFMLSASYNYHKKAEADIWLRYVSALAAGDVDAYYSLNARLSYKITDRLTGSVALLNLLKSEHQEFVPEYNIYPSEVPRTFYLKLTYEM